MNIAGSFIKVTIGRSLLALTEKGRLNFFPEKTEQLKYYFVLSHGFLLPEIYIAYDKTLPPLGFNVYINETLRYTGDVMPAGSLVIKEGSQEFFDETEHLLFMLFQVFSSNIDDFLNESLFEDWVDDSTFYEQGSHFDKVALYKEFCSSFEKNISLWDKRLFAEKMSEQTHVAHSHNSPLLLKALFLIASGRLLRAQNLLKTFYEEVATGGIDYVATHLLANFLLSQGKKDEAMSYFSLISKNCHFYNKIMYFSARYTLESGDPYISSQIISCARELYPNDYMIKYIYSDFLIRTGRERTGLKKLEELTSKKGVFPGILVHAALIFIDDYEKSLGFSKKALLLSPDHVEAMFVMAQLYFSNGLYEESLELLNKVISLDKNYARALNLRGKVSLSLDNLEQAERDLKKSSDLDSCLIFDLAEYYVFKGDIESALPLIDETLSSEPFHVKANEYKAHFLVSSGEIQKASAIYSKLLFLSPENIEYMACLADLNFKQGDEAAALEILRKAFKIAPHNELVAELLGWYYLEKGNFKQAEKVFDSCIASGCCENILVLCGKAVISFRNKQFDEAQALCSLCISLSPECDRAFYILSKICLESGDINGALKHIKSALKLVPDSEEYISYKKKIGLKK